MNKEVNGDTGERLLLVTRHDHANEKNAINAKSVKEENRGSYQFRKDLYWPWMLVKKI